MLPIIAAVPTPMELMLDFSLIVPVLGALALCGAAAVSALVPRTKRPSGAPQAWSTAHPPYACTAPR